MSSRHVVIGALVVCIAGVGGYLAHRTLPAAQEEGGSLKPPAITLSRPAAPSPEQPAEPEPRQPVVPETLPEFTLKDSTGVSRTLGDWKGRPRIVNFWATWCGPCRDEIPLLKSLRHERAADRLEVIGVAIDARDDVLKYARDIGMDYPILIGEKEGYAAAEAFGVSLVLPFSVFGDRKGRIVTLKIGQLHADEAAFILDRVRDIDANRLDLAAARRQIGDKMRDFAVQRGRKSAPSG